MNLWSCSTKESEMKGQTIAVPAAVFSHLALILQLTQEHLSSHKLASKHQKHISGKAKHVLIVLSHS